MGLSAAACPIMAVVTNQRVKGKIMAGKGDMKAHEDTYSRVMGILTWGTVGCFLVGALVVFLIAT